MGQRAHRPAHYTAAGRAGAGGHGPDPGVVQMLSQASGNAVVAGMLRRTRPARASLESLDEGTPAPSPGTTTRTSTFQLETTIAYDPEAEHPAAAPVPAASDRDAGPGEETGDEQEAEIERLALDPPMPSGADPESANPAVPASPEAPMRGEEAPGEEREEDEPEHAAAAPAEEAGREAPVPVSLPDIVIPELANLEETDDVSSFLGYSSSVTRGGAGPRGFGVTRWGDLTLKSIKVIPLAWLGVFVVRATIEHKITWQVRSGTGPRGQVDIGSFLSGSITAANYEDVADDLTPDMSDLNGRPPRDAFWAEDLTERHEEFHADEVETYAPAAVGVASSWLSAQTAANVAGVHALLAGVPGRVITALQAARPNPGKEERAYGDGAPLYQRRALAIRATGAAGLYS